MSETGGPGEEAEPTPAERAVVHLRAAATAFDVIRIEISELLEEVRGGDTERGRKLKPILGDLARAISVLAKAGELVDDERRRIGAEVSDPSLDLAAARSEVERRLAQLRDTG